MIKWFPGHMAKSYTELELLMKKTDIMIEVLDARLPISSSNPKFTELRRDKPCIKLLNKYDLSDPKVTSSWIKYLENEKVKALAVVAKRQIEIKKLSKMCKELVPKRGNPGFPIRAIVVGIPNVGKSTLINTLAGKSIANVGD